MKTKSYQFLIKSYLVSGFSLAELILSSIIALVVMTMLGYGLYNLLRNDLSNNADGDLVNNSNNAANFIAQEIQQAQEIKSGTNVGNVTGASTAANRVMQIVHPDFVKTPTPTCATLIYYTDVPRTSDRLIGPRVLYRYGLDLDSNGNYNTAGNCGTSPIVDRLPARGSAVVSVACATGWTRAPSTASDIDGFFVCTQGTKLVNLKLSAAVNLTTGDTKQVIHSVDTKVFARATATTP